MYETGPVKVRYFEQEVTIDNRTLKSYCFFQLITAQFKEKTTLDTKNIIIHYDNVRLLIDFSIKKLNLKSK